MNHYQELSYFFTAIIGTLGMGVASMLYLANRNQHYQAKLLASVLLCLTLSGMNQALITTNFFIQNPHLWRILVLTTLLQPVLAYLYVRSVLEQQLKMKKWDWLFAIPAILYTASYFDFYLKNTDEKRAIVELIQLNPLLFSQEPEGMLPAGLGIIIRMTFGLGMGIAQLAIIRQWQKMIYTTTIPQKQNKEMINWLYYFSSVLILAYFTYLTLTLFQLTGIYNLFIQLSITTFGCILFICVYLLTKQHILFGLKGWLQSEELNIAEIGNKYSLNKNNANRTTFSSAQQQEYKLQLEKYFNKKKPFTQPGYKISDLAVELRMPVNLLSAFINQEYGKSFNQLLNEYRVEYMHMLLNTSSEYHRFSLEAIATSAGFKSRKTFCTAVKEKTGVTPSEYFNKI